MKRVAEVERVVALSIDRHRRAQGQPAGGIEPGLNSVVAVPAALRIVGDGDLLGLGSHPGDNRLTIAIEPDRPAHEGTERDHEVEDAEPADTTLAGHLDLRLSGPSRAAGPRSSRVERPRPHRSKAPYATSRARSPVRKAELAVSGIAAASSQGPSGSRRFGIAAADSPSDQSAAYAGRFHHALANSTAQPGPEAVPRGVVGAGVACRIQERRVLPSTIRRHEERSSTCSASAWVRRLQGS